MSMTDDFHDIFLNYDPVAPHARHQALNGYPQKSTSHSGAVPSPVPWPEKLAPKAHPLTPAPEESDDLSRFKGWDAVIVTWTAAEATALATLFVPEFPITAWYEYRHNIQDYIPLVTGKRAPFNSSTPEMHRYYHSLGLYFPCQIGDMKVLLFKSGLHLDYDGPAAPVGKLMTEIAAAISPRIFITTGTGGGIGKDVLLGDVQIAGMARFDCKAQFEKEPWAQAGFSLAHATPEILQAIVPALTTPNAQRIQGARPNPKFFHAQEDAVVTTDFFAFDDSTNHFGLQGLGRVCDMGDAMVAKALSGFRDMKVYSVRNASDPQIPNPNKDIKEAEKQAGEIYTKYGALTTAASVVASWALVVAK